MQLWFSRSSHQPAGPALPTSPWGKISGSWLWAQSWMVSSCRAVCPFVHLQREAPEAGGWRGKSDTYERWAGSGTGRTWQLAAGGGGGSLCSSGFTLWVTSGEGEWGDGRAPGARKMVATPLRMNWKSQGGWQLPLELEADRCEVGLWGDMWFLDRAWMSEAMEKSCLDSSSTVLYFLFVWSQPGGCTRTLQG